ncbi:MAG: TonB-dependent receptor [Bacteroidota bacterium]
MVEAVTSAVFGHHLFLDFTPDQNLVLIDGITAYGIDHYFGMFSAVNNQAIENVNINRGGFGAKYGGRLSGIIDVSGKRATADSLKLYTHLSLLNSNVSIEMPLYKDKVTLLLAGRKSFPLAQKNPLYNALTGNFSNSSQSIISQNDPVKQYTTIIPEFDFSDANVKLSIRPGINDLIEASFFTSTDNLNYFVQDGEDAPLLNRLTSEEVLKIKNLGYSFSWSHQWSEKFYSKQNVAYSTYSNQYENTVQVDGDTSFFGAQALGNSVNDLTIRSDYMLNINRHNKLSFGLHYKGLTSLNVEEIISESGDFSNELDDYGQALAGYAQYDLELSEKFSISSGLRMVNYRPFKTNYFEPRLSATYRFSPNFSSKIAWGRYNQFIRQFDVVNGLGLANNYWVVSGDSTLPVSSAEHFILGAAFETSGFLIDVEVYQKNLYELSTVQFTSSPFEAGVSGDRGFFNEGTGKSRGVDVMIQRKSRKYEGWLSYSYNQTMHTFKELNDGNPFPASHENRHQVKLVNSIHLGNWSFGGTLIFATGNPYTDALGPIRRLDENGFVEYILEPAKINGRRLPNYHRLDISAVYNFPIGLNGNGKFGVSLYNVYNRINIRNKRIQLFNQVDGNGNVTPLRIESDILHQPFIPNFFIQANF